MSLNDYRDEAEEFLKKIGSENEGTDIKVNMLEDELNFKRKK
ncbi:hypothetical protein SH2C18_35140 [Clostridium sediminicola]